jgi:hypothetical protein
MIIECLCRLCDVKSCTHGLREMQRPVSNGFMSHVMMHNGFPYKVATGMAGVPTVACPKEAKL